MKIHQPISFNAANFGMPDLALPGERIAGVFHPANDLTLVVANVGVDVHLVSAAVLEHKVVLPLVVARQVPIAQAAEDAQKAGKVLLVDGNIQVGMGAGLPAQVSVHSPTAINYDRYAGDFCQVDNAQGLFLIQFRSQTGAQAERNAFQDFFKKIWLTWFQTDR